MVGSLCPGNQGRYNSIRRALNDCHPSKDKDWVVPFMIAMDAFKESHYRRLLGLPDVLAEQDPLGHGAPLHYYNCLNDVLDGAKYPNFEWEKRGVNIIAPRPEP